MFSHLDFVPTGLPSANFEKSATKTTVTLSVLFHSHSLDMPFYGGFTHPSLTFLYTFLFFLPFLSRWHCKALSFTSSEFVPFLANRPSYFATLENWFISLCFFFFVPSFFSAVLNLFFFFFLYILNHFSCISCTLISGYPGTFHPFTETKYNKDIQDILPGRFLKSGSSPFEGGLFSEKVRKNGYGH